MYIQFLKNYLKLDILYRNESIFLCISDKSKRVLLKNDVVHVLINLKKIIIYDHLANWDTFQKKPNFMICVYI